MTEPSEAATADPTDAQKANALQTLAPALYSSVSKLAGSSKALPFDRDFHFYYNFDEFKAPIKEIVQESQSLLQSIGSSTSAWGKKVAFPEDLDDAYDWLVNVNDEVLERFDASVDEFQRLRKMEEESGKRIMDVSDGFQQVYGKKKNKAASGNVAAGSASRAGETTSVKIASLRDKKVAGAKPKIPFHIPSIRRPQDEYNILVNNSNQPFQHVWLQRSEDGERFVHPLENLSVSDFVDKNASDIKPAKPPALEHTPFKIVTEVKDLKELAAKLRGVDEFAVDLEHNQYRSFQGLTCLIQISTRSEDFVVDALKLRIHIGPYLREVFKDPAKKKVMHGADRDIIWLQRDFGIYVCNLFDTGQASRMLKLERNSLEHLLHHFCGVTANKEYQNADWRLRPLPEEMLRYAREDTHFLLYIYDLMRIELYAMSGQSDEALVEVYKRSSEICMQLYQKEIFSDSSYLHIYGLQAAGFNAQQLAIVAGLFEWRDTVARAEDESTGYILPNKTLLEIAKQMPVTTSKLHRIVKSKHSFIERYLGTVVSIIRHAMQNASAFEVAVEQLREARVETAPEENQSVNEGSEVNHSDSPPKQETGDASPQSNENITALASPMEDDPMEVQACNAVPSGGVISSRPGKDGNVPDRNTHVSVNEVPSTLNRSRDTDVNASTLSSATLNSSATVQILKKPSRGFGALFGSTGPKKKIEPEKKDKEEKKLEQIRSSVNLYFHTFSGKKNEPMEADVVEPPESPEKPAQQPQEVAAVQFNASSADVIILDDDSDEVEEEEEEEEKPSVPKDSETTAKESEERISVSSGMESDSEDEQMSLSDLSSSFQKCFESMKKDGKSEKSAKSGGVVQVKPFDYEAARMQVAFGEAESEGRRNGDRKGVKNSRGKKSGSAIGNDEAAGKELGQGRRRQAFPASGNRSATFR